MLSFFRKIRKSLLKEGKTARYFKYAIGEILLVVIGILIALQINNWNNEKNNRIFELKMLKQIKLSLLEDKQHFESMIIEMDKLLETNDFIVSLIAKQVSYNDDYFVKVFDLNKNIDIINNIGPYEALKTTGIDKVSSDQLRNNLIYFYEFMYPRFISLLEHYNRNTVDGFGSLVSFFENPKIKIINEKPRLIQDLQNDLFENEDFHRLLRGITFRSLRLKRTMTEFIPKIDEMINDLDLEIEKGLST